VTSGLSGRWELVVGEGLAVGLLGPLEVSLAGTPVALTAGRQRTLLAMLAISAGRPVAVDRLADGMWGTELPGDARRSVQIYVTRLRAALCPEAIGTTAGGYVLHVDPDAVDALRFGRLLDGAAAAPDRAGERARLAEALALWRGTPFEGLRSDWLGSSEGPRLVERYLAAVERCVDLDVADDRPRELVATVRELTGRHPLRESLWVRLLVVLDRCGRQAEALERYQAIRAHLANELGVDPGPELQRVYADLLAGRPARLPDGTGSIASYPVVPRQLPAPPVMFTGRATELADLDRAHDPTTVVVHAVDGMAGIGKTALAVQAAHRIADRYPDGQLFIDLHGYTEGVAPVEPAEALDRMLRALGIGGEQIPNGLEDRAALYRSRLADQRVLVVLDNAAAETQVAPLLPGAPGCLVLVTSRHRLAGLDHARAVSLEVLPVADAFTLFTDTVGATRLAGQPPELLAELIELCGRLPLAIRIAAARLRSHPTWTLADLVERLRDQQHRLSELEAGQRSVTAALDLSYRHLSPGQQRTYRLLSLHPGLEFDAYATAALLDSGLQQAQRMLDQLVGVHLLLEPAAGRYRFHDLVRAHAAATGEHIGGAALDRLLDHYRHTASLAMDAAHPYERERRPRVPAARTPAPDHADQGWLDAELPNLLAAARYAAEHGRPEHVGDLSRILHRHLRSRGRYHEAEALHHQALAASQGAGTVPAQVCLGWVYLVQGRYGQATDHLGQALRAAGEPAGGLDALIGLGLVDWLQARHQPALDQLGQALQLARDLGHRAGELDALAGLGLIHQMQGRYEQAAIHFEQALQIARATGNRTGERVALIGIGNVSLWLGRYEQAAVHHRQALRIASAAGDRPGELVARNGLGQVQRVQSRYVQAIPHYRQALQIARAIGHRAGELAALNGLGQIQLRLGQYAEAADRFGQLHDLARAVGDHNFEYEAWQGLGRLRCATGDPDAAIVHHGRALELAGELGQPLDQARAHDGLARAHHALDRHEDARRHWAEALDILTRVGVDHTDDEEASVLAIRTRLADLDGAYFKPVVAPNRMK
jgi:DNA-binding SARP family transcriptional activator/tetratricopeptide (TPR) repeat protein